MLNDAFLTLKNNLELTDTFGDTISQRHNAVRSAIENLGRSDIETKLIGSLQRQTRVHPRPGDVFDIDILVVLGSFYNWLQPGDPNGITPQMAMESAHSLVEESDRYGAMDPQQDRPTVTFSYADDVKVELVPAYKDKIGRSPAGVSHTPADRGYWIPNSSGGWDFADYDYDAAYVSAVNKNSGGVFIPLVKMLKAIKRTHFPAIKSYHLEVVAANVVPGILADFQRRNVAVTYPNLIAAFLHGSDNHLFVPLKLPGSNSPAVEPDPLAKVQIADVLTSLKEQSKQALLTGSETEKQRTWREIFGDAMPAI